MITNNSFWLYIFLAGIREYRSKNKFSLHKLIFFIVYCLFMMLVCYTAFYIGINQHIVATILLFILSILSFYSVDFDNYISYCQNLNNKILMAYPRNYGDILLVNSFKYLFIHLFTINVGMVPFLIIFLHSLDNPIWFIIKFLLLMNLLCISISWFGWIRWIKKWQEVKLKKKARFKLVGIILSGIILLIAISLLKKEQIPIFMVFNLVFNNMIAFNHFNHNYFERYYYWIIIAIICLVFVPIIKYIKTHLAAIYEFYIFNNGDHNITLKINYLERFLNKQKKMSVSLKKEFYTIARNENIYNELLRKIKYSIIFCILLSIYFYVSPFTINFYTISIFISIGITGYGDNVIRNLLPISSEGRMILNYIQSNVDIKKVLNNKVNMLFLYRQFFIIGPLIFAFSVTKLNVIDILYFLIIWLVLSYTTANIKVYSISSNSKYLTTEDFFKKMTIPDIVKYFILENSYYFLLIMVLLLCNIFVSNIFAIVIGILWVSVIYNVIIFLIQGDGKKFYGEYKEFV